MNGAVIVFVMMSAAGGAMLLALGFIIGWRAGRHGQLFITRAHHIQTPKRREEL
ncbi:MAG TPA: hypothetical protein PKM88_07515 [bacterium]|nr:hypothetical protein [bacterium]